MLRGWRASTGLLPHLCCVLGFLSLPWAWHLLLCCQDAATSAVVTGNSQCQRDLAALGALLVALLHNGSDLRLNLICLAGFSWPFLASWSSLKSGFFFPSPLRLEDGAIAALGPVLAVCHMLEVKASSQEKDLTCKVGTAGTNKKEIHQMPGLLPIQL